jgi:hypothetical protein
MLTSVTSLTAPKMAQVSVLVIAACLTGLAHPVAAAAEDLVITSKVTSQNRITQSSLYMTASQLKRSDDQRETIIDFPSGRVIRIDRTKKQYSENSREEINAINQRMFDQLKQSPQAAQMMETMIGQVTVSKGPGSKKIAGYDCQEYLVTMGQAMKMDIWTTTALTAPMAATQMYEALSMLGGSSPMSKSLGAVYAEMGKLKGVALGETSTVSIMGATVVTSSEATEVKRGPIDPAMFAAPAGFTKVDPPGMRGLKR